MSHLKKDILNGWKEIAAYVARDRRTVERWEKQRGLPVRRVPGEGRATVYALISELDEWLASSKPDEAEDAELGTAEPTASPVAAPTDNSAATAPVPVPAADGTGGSQQSGRNETAPKQRAATSGNDAVWWPTAGRWEQIASWTILAGLGLIFVLASRDLRSPLPSFADHSKAHADSGAAGSVVGEPNSAIPYRSQVAGVDELYLAGVYSSEQRTPESLERAEQDFANAIQKDPNYAPAYAGLADTYVLLREYYVMPDEEAFTKAKEAALHAIALDPRLSEAHATLGFIDFFWSWDAAKAEREFQTALAEDPSSAHAHHWYGSMLTHEGRYDEALEHLNIAQRLEPTSAAILSTRALALGLSGHRGDAVDMLEGLIRESPGVSSPHAILAILSRVEPQDWERYLDELRRTAELRHNDEILQVEAAAEPALRQGGERAMWTTILATEEKLHPGSANRTFLMAVAETGLGQNDAAFADLNLVAQRHETDVRGVMMDPTLAPLRRDRRFGQLREMLGLPATGSAGSRSGEKGMARPSQ